jgi:hypothetical protein
MKPETEIKTIVLISPPPVIGNLDKMPPKDGFTWRKYGEKEILGFKYSRYV